MKHFFTKPVVTVVAVAAIAGGLTPVWASSASWDSSKDVKVVMGTEGAGVTRYSLKELVEDDPALLNFLLKTQADRLYLVAEALNLNVKLSDFIEEKPEEWETIYQKHDEDIYLEVRFDEAEGFLKLEQETKDDVAYISGTVADDVTKVVIVKPGGDSIEVTNLTDNKFTVSLPVPAGTSAPYVTLKAYAGDKLVETEKLQIKWEDVAERDAVIYTAGAYDAKKNKVNIYGLVLSSVDEVRVTYGGVTKKPELKKLWNGTRAFAASFSAEDGGAEAEAVVEAYVDGEKVDAQKVLLEKNSQPDPADGTFAVTGQATISPKDKVVQIKGSITTPENVVDASLKLLVTAPDGQKHEVKLSDDHTFEASISYKNRSYSSKAVHVELYNGTTLVAEADIPHGIPDNRITPPVKPLSVTSKATDQSAQQQDDDAKDEKKGDKNGKKENKQFNGKAHGHKDKEKWNGKWHGKKDWDDDDDRDDHQDDDEDREDDGDERDDD